MSKIIKIPLVIITIIAASLFLGNQAYAETGTETLSQTGYILAALSFVTAGVYYSTSGFIKKLARSLHGDTTIQIDYKKVGRTTLLGIIIGVGAFVFAEYNGETIHITTTNDFIIQVGLNLAAVLTIDRLILGSYSKPKEPSTPSLEFPDDVKEQVPPGIDDK